MPLTGARVHLGAASASPAEQLRRRKEIYEAAHPETARPKGGRPKKTAKRIRRFQRTTKRNRFAWFRYGDRGNQHTKAKSGPVPVEAIVPQPAPEPAKPREDQARDQAAKVVNVAPRYVSDAKAVAAQAPDLAAKVKAGELTLPQARTEVKRREKRAELEARAAAAPAPSR